jgi:ankyrin repeat protein
MDASLCDRFTEALILDKNRDALFTAIIEKNSVQLNEILKQDPSVVDRQDPVFGFTPLMLASRLGNLEAATCLLKSKASVDAVNIRQQTALMLAVTNDRKELANTLLEAGADIKPKDDHGRTAQDLAELNRVYGIQFKRI